MMELGVKTVEKCSIGSYFTIEKNGGARGLIVWWHRTERGRSFGAGKILAMKGSVASSGIELAVAAREKPLPQTTHSP